MVRWPAIGLIGFLGACAANPAAPPASLGLDPFYEQALSAAGIPVVSSSRVTPKALRAARSMAEEMLAFRPDLARYLAMYDYRMRVDRGGRGAARPAGNRGWQKPAEDDPRLTRCEKKHYEERIGASPHANIGTNARAGAGRHMVGAGGCPRPAASRYYGETIFVHEFSHQILDAVRYADEPLYGELEAAYANAKATGLWRDEYTMTTIDEYWAEGSQFWFDSNRLQVFDGRRILGHDDLAAYDPALFAVLAKVYGANHKLTADPFWMSPARVPPGPPPENTAEVC